MKTLRVNIRKGNLIFSFLIILLAIYSSVSAQDDLAKQLENLKKRRSYLASEADRREKEMAKRGPQEPLDATGKELPESLKYQWMALYAKREALWQESVIKSNWADSLMRQSEESYQKSKIASSPEVAESYKKDARHKADLAERILGLFEGAPSNVKATPAQPSAVTPEKSKPKEKRADVFNAGIFDQMDKNEEWSKRAAVENNPQATLNKAVQDFGEGRAGAGGVSFYKSAEILTPLNMNEVRGVDFQNNRLILLYGDKRIAFPPMDPEYLALAIRSIYGNEGIVRGKLSGESPRAIAIQTGHEQFGEVAWKKEFLTVPWVKVPLGEPLELSLGPGIGFISQPEPSTKKVSYYGPIKRTRMGRVLLEADGLLITLSEGIDWKTGLPQSPPDIEGYMSLFERFTRALVSTESREKLFKSVSEVPGQKQWWEQSIWLVLVPDHFSLRLTKDATAFEFVDARMKLSVWSSEEENRKPSCPYPWELGEHFNEHYQEMTKAFPVLKDLEEVAKAVTVVRWLKQNNVPVDVSWSNAYKIQAADTPETIHGFMVIPEIDASGKPIIEKQVKE